MKRTIHPLKWVVWRLIQLRKYFYSIVHTVLTKSMIPHSVNIALFHLLGFVTYECWTVHRNFSEPDSGCLQFSVFEWLIEFEGLWILEIVIRIYTCNNFTVFMSFIKCDQGIYIGHNYIYLFRLFWIILCHYINIYFTFSYKLCGIVVIIPSQL